MANANLDSVVINVESVSTGATQGIGRLITALNNLKKEVGMTAFSKFATTINTLKENSNNLPDIARNIEAFSPAIEHLKKLSEIETPSGLTYVITRLNELSETSKTLEKTAANVAEISKIVQPLSTLSSIETPSGLGTSVKYLTELSKIPNMDKMISDVSKLPEIVEPLKSLGEIPAGRGLGTLVNNLSGLPDVMARLGDTGTLANLGRVADELVTHLQPLSDEMQKIANGYSAISKMSDTYGVSAKTVTRYAAHQESIFKKLATTIYTKVTDAFKAMGRTSKNAIDSSMKALSKLNSKLRQTMLALIGTRTLFTMLRKAVHEYTAMDVELQKYTQNVWRAFGAQLAPAIQYAMYLFKQFVRVIYSVVLALTGIDLIARANKKAMLGWGKAAKDTLGNLQKFDDLNVVEFPSSGSGSGDDSLIDLQTIDLTPFLKIIEWVKKVRDEIKAALDTGEWINVGRVFGEGISEGVEFLLGKMPLIRDKLLTIARDFGQFLQGAIESINWSSVGSLLSESLKLLPDMITKLFTSIRWVDVGHAINDFFEGFDAVGLVHSIMTAFGKAIDAFFTVLSTLDWGLIAQKIGEAIATFFSDLSTILSKIPWEQIGTKIKEAIENIPWSDIWDGIVESAGELKKGLEELLSSLTGIPVEGWQALEGALVGIGIALVTYDLYNKFVLLTGVLGKFGKVVGSGSFLTFAGVLAGIALAALGIYLLVQDIKKLLEDPTWANFFKVVSDIALIAAGIALVIGVLTGAWIPLLIAAIVGLVASIAALIAENWDKITEWLSGVWKTITDFFSGIGTWISDTVTGIWNAICDVFNDAVQGVADFFASIGEGIAKFFTEDIPQWWDDFKNGIATRWDNFKTRVKNAFEDFTTKVKDFVSNIVSTVKEKIDKVKSFLSSIGEWVYNHVIKPVIDKFNTLKDKISSIFDKIKTSVTDAWSNMWSGLKDIINKILGGVESFINNIIKGINGLSKGLRSIGNKIFDLIGVDVKFDALAEVSIPRLETGTNEIPYEGLYHLHPGEAVVPKQYNPALGGGTNEDTNNRLDKLIDLLEEQDHTTVVNIGNRKLYQETKKYSNRQVNKYGTIAVS